jgi:hypothetical protein
LCQSQKQMLNNRRLSGNDSNCLRPQDPVPDHIARRVINRFDRAVTGKILLRKEMDMEDLVAMARSLGEAHGLEGATYDGRPVAPGSRVVLVRRSLSNL